MRGGKKSKDGVLLDVMDRREEVRLINGISANGKEVPQERTLTEAPSALKPVSLSRNEAPPPYQPPLFRPSPLSHQIHLGANIPST